MPEQTYTPQQRLELLGIVFDRLRARSPEERPAWLHNVEWSLSLPGEGDDCAEELGRRKDSSNQ